MLLDGVLGGDHEERVRQDMPDVVHRDLPLGHGFQQGALGARRGAVDLVGQEHVGKDGPGQEFELAGVLVEDAEPGDVARQQVGRALDPRELAAQGLRQGLGQGRLAQPGQVFDQQVAPRQQAGQHVLDHLGLAPQSRVERGANSFDWARNCVPCPGREVRHHSQVGPPFTPVMEHEVGSGRASRFSPRDGRFAGRSFCDQVPPGHLRRARGLPSRPAGPALRSAVRITARLARNRKIPAQERCTSRPRTPRPPRPPLDQLDRLKDEPPGVARGRQTESHSSQPIEQVVAAPDEHRQPAQGGQQPERMPHRPAPKSQKSLGEQFGPGADRRHQLVTRGGLNGDPEPVRQPDLDPEVDVIASHGRVSRCGDQTSPARRTAR